VKDFDDSGAPQTSPFLARLAGSPLLVVAVTLAIGVAVTGILMCVAPMDSVAIVTTLATVWGLDLALVIYLLTAKDTDKLLAHIDALQDQLSAALEGPGPDAVVVEGTPPIESTSSPQALPQSEETPQGVTVSEAPVQPGPSPEAPAQPGRTPKVRPHPSHVHGGTTPVPQTTPTPQVTAVPQTTAVPLPVATYMPADYVEALRRQAGLEAADIQRAWTPNPHGNGPWVAEDADGNRWSVFQGRRDQPTVISLESRERLHQIREQKQEVRQRLHDENQQLRRQLRDEEQQRVHALQEARSNHTPRSRNSR